MVLTTLLNSFSLTFPWFPGQNESFSPTNFFFTRNTSVGYQSLSIKGGYKGGETNLKIEVHIICEKKQAEKILNCCMQSQLKIFFCIFVNFCTLVLLYPLTSPDRRNHVTHGQPQKISFAKLSTYSYIEIKHLHLMCDGNLVERKQSSNSQVKALRSWLINALLWIKQTHRYMHPDVAGRKKPLISFLKVSFKFSKLQCKKLGHKLWDPIRRSYTSFSI